MCWQAVSACVTDGEHTAHSAHAWPKHHFISLAACCCPPLQALRLDACRLEDFEVGHVLGTGSFGRVSLARHRGTGMVCAIKALSKAHIVKNQQASMPAAGRRGRQRAAPVAWPWQQGRAATAGTMHSGVHLQNGPRKVRQLGEVGSTSVHPEQPKGHPPRR